MKIAFAQCGVRKVRKHGDLHRCNNLSRIHRDGSAAKNTVALSIDQGFEEAFCLGKSSRSQDRSRRDFRNAIWNLSCPGFCFTEADACKFRVCEDAEGHLTS